MSDRTYLCISDQLMAKYKPELDKLLGDWHIEKIPNEHKSSGVSGGWQIKVTQPSTPTTLMKVLTAATFYIEQLQGCCGVAVSYSSYIPPSYRRKGLGTLLNKLRIEMARAMGYGLLLCTDKADNMAQRKILAKNGWADIYPFRNPRTGNRVNISVVNL